MIFFICFQFSIQMFCTKYALPTLLRKALRDPNKSSVSLELFMFWLKKKELFMFWLGFSGGSDGKESACNVGDLGLIPTLERSLRGGHSNANPVFLPGESPRTKSLAGYSPWACKESDMTECKHTHRFWLENLGPKMLVFFCRPSVCPQIFSGAFNMHMQ